MSKKVRSEASSYFIFFNLLWRLVTRLNRRLRREYQSPMQEVLSIGLDIDIEFLKITKNTVEWKKKYIFFYNRLSLSLEKQKKNVEKEEKKKHFFFQQGPLFPSCSLKWWMRNVKSVKNNDQKNTKKNKYNTNFYFELK